MKKILFFAGMSLMMASCYNDKYDKLYPAPPPTTCDTTNVSFSATILPLLRSDGCTVSGCHDAASSTMDLTSYSSRLVRDAGNGTLLSDINQGSGSDPMPKSGGKIAACDINKITAWINQGYKNN